MAGGAADSILNNLIHKNMVTIVFFAPPLRKKEIIVNDLMLKGSVQRLVYLKLNMT